MKGKSNLINGFKDPIQLKSFFNCLAENVKHLGDTLNGDKLLHAACNVDGFNGIEDIFHIYREQDKERIFSKIEGYDDILNTFLKNEEHLYTIDDYFKNESTSKFERFVDENDDYLRVQTPIGTLIFGERDKAPSYSRKIIKRDRFFVTIDENNCSGKTVLIYDYTFSSDNFYFFVNLIRSIVNKLLHLDYLDRIEDIWFNQEVSRNVAINKKISERKIKPLESDDQTWFTDDEIMTILNQEMIFTRSLSNWLFSEIKSLFNNNIFFTLSGLENIDDFPNPLAEATEIAGMFPYSVDAFDYITIDLFDKYDVLLITSKGILKRSIVKSVYIDEIKKVKSKKNTLV